MKKILSLLLALTLVFALVACSNEKDTTSEPDTSTTTQTEMESTDTNDTQTSETDTTDESSSDTETPSNSNPTSTETSKPTTSNKDNTTSSKPTDTPSTPTTSKPTETSKPTTSTPSTPTHTHSWGSWKTETKALIGKDGSEKRTCSSCKEVEKRSTKASAAHNSFFDFYLHEYFAWFINSGNQTTFDISALFKCGDLIARDECPITQDSTIAVNDYYKALKEHFVLNDAIISQMKSQRNTDTYPMTMDGFTPQPFDTVVGYTHNGGNKYTVYWESSYYEATKRFCKFLADNFRLQNFKNVEDRHFKAYVEHLKENNSAATIQSDLSGIRYFHRKSGSKNRLSKNDKLSLPKRATGVKDHSWLKTEIDSMRQLATQTGRQDVVIAIDFAHEFGLRLEEICTLRVEYLMSALKTGKLVIKGKGGQTRAIDLSAKQRSIITKYLDYARCSGRYPRDYLISASEKDGVKREKRSLQNWMSYNRKSFIVENREDLYEDGKKRRTETISWHGLRHTYAQRTYAEALQERPKKARKIVSENLGHHRTEVTRIYLADKPQKK